MKQVRRVVTGTSDTGKPMIVSDTLVEGAELKLAPSHVFLTLWGSDNIPSVPNTGSNPNFQTWYPPPGGFRFAVLTLPPRGTTAGDMSALTPEQIQAMMADGIAEGESKVPGLLPSMEFDHPGFHRSNTIELVYILSGAAVVDLDDSKTVSLSAGDSIVQNGTRHNWHNPSLEPLVLLVTMIGAEPKAL
jgi:mannose-6-phosphate isomerase-like protein (cupin superfamily)